MQTRQAVIAIGANLGDRAGNIFQAVEMIDELVGPVEKQSQLYQTAPLVLPGTDPLTVPPYLNAAVRVSTRHAPETLLAILLRIERSLGRLREQELERWLSRVIDLDIVALEDEVYTSNTLTIPHPHMHQRDFVLEPMLEVAPDWRHPLLAKTVRELLQAFHALPGGEELRGHLDVVSADERGALFDTGDGRKL